MYASSPMLMSPRTQDAIFYWLRLMVALSMVLTAMMPGVPVQSEYLVGTVPSLGDVFEELWTATGAPATAGGDESALAPVAASQPAPFAVLGEAPGAARTASTVLSAEPAALDIAPFATLGGAQTSAASSSAVNATDTSSEPKAAPGLLLAPPASTQAAPLADNFFFATGTLIIPMDTVYQNLGMWKAYGLVYRLLDNNIPINWVIADNKNWNAVDFCADAKDLRTNANIATDAGAPCAGHNYFGGPFVIDSAYAAQAIPLIQTWWTANGNQPTVHQADAPFTGNINSVLKSPPRIALDDNGGGIALPYLVAAGIPDPFGNPAWPDNGDGTDAWLTAVEVAGAKPPSNSATDAEIQAVTGDGAFFQNGLCSRRAFDILVTPHSDGYGVTDNSLTAFGNNAYSELDWFLRQGGGWTVMCHSIEIMDAAFADLYNDTTPVNGASRLFAPPPGFIGGQRGAMLTETGIRDLPNQGTAWWLNDAADPLSISGNFADLPVAQVAKTTAVNALPGGSGQSGFNTTTAYYDETEVLAYFTTGTAPNYSRWDHAIAGSYRDGTGAGKITYIGGHSFSTSLPYSGNFEAPYLRMFYNTLFFNANGKATFDMAFNPTAIPQGIDATVTITIANVGGSTAEGLNSFTVKLEPGLSSPVVVSGPNFASLLGDANTGITLSWSDGSLAAPVAGETPLVVITATALGTSFPSIVTGKEIASFQLRYGDTAGEGFYADICRNLDVGPAPAPVVDKELEVQGSPTPLLAGSVVTWTIEYGNTGLAPLVSAVVTDLLPVGYTVIVERTSPAFTSSTLQPDGSLLIQWNVGTVPSSTNPAGVITLVAQTETLLEGTSTATNRAGLSGQTASGIPVSATPDEVIVTVAAPNLRLEKTVSEDVAAPGDTLTYTITVGYTDTIPLVNAVITDSMSLFTTYVTNTATPTPTFTGTTAEGNDLLVWNVGTNTAGTSGVVSPTNFAIGTFATAAELGAAVGGSNRQPDIAVDSAGFAHVVFSDNQDQIYYTNNSSGSFAAATAVSANGNYRTPQIAIDANNKLHVVYSNNDNDVYYTSSTNSGGTWSAQVELGAAVGGSNRQPDIAVDSAGFAHVVFSDNQDQIYYTNNSSGSFAAATAVSANDNYRTPQIAIDANNKLHVVYSNNDNDVYYTSSTNSGGTWSAQVELGAAVGGSNRQPDIAVDSAGFAHVVFSDNQDQIYYTNNSSGSFAAATAVSANDNYRTPQIAIRTAGSCGDVIHVVYSNNDNDVYYTYRSVSGSTWSTQVEIGAATANNRTPAVAVFSDKVHVVYSNNNADVYHSSATLSQCQVGTGTALAAFPLLLSGNGQITVTMVVTAGAVVSNVTPPASLTITGTNGATATLASGPTPSAGQTVSPTNPVTFTYVFDAVQGFNIGDIRFSGAPTATNASFAAGVSNNTLMLPPLVFQATVNDPFDPAITRVTNRARLVDGIAFQNGVNAQVNTTILQPILTLSKANNPTGEFGPDDPITYTLTLANNGTLTATNVIVRDTVPASTTYVAGSCTPNSGGETCGLVGGQVVWTLPSVPTDTVRTLTFVVAGLTGLPTGIYTVTNSASVTATNFVTPAVSNLVTNTLVVEPELAIVKLQDSNSFSKTDSLVQPGDLITYTVVVTNVGASSASNVVITDAIPAGVTYVGGSATCVAGPFSSGRPVNQASGVVTCNVGASGFMLQQGDVAFLEFVVQVKTPNISGFVIPNVAYLTAKDLPETPSNFVSYVVAASPVLVIDKRVTPTGQVQPGDILTYTITITNVGNANTTASTAIDPLPSGLAYVPLSTRIVSGTGALDSITTTVVVTEITPGSNPLESGTAICSPEWCEESGDGGLLVVGQPGRIFFNVRVLEPVSNSFLISNVAFAQVPGQPITSTPPVTSPVFSTPELLITKSVVPTTSVAPGGTLAYTLRVTNTGAMTATGVTVQDVLPPNTSFVSASAPGSESGGVITWSPLTVDPLGGAITLTFSVLVTAPWPSGVAPITNTAVASYTDYTSSDPNSAFTQPITSNTTLNYVRQVTVSKEIVSPLGGVVGVGKNVVYSITVQNTGNITIATTPLGGHLRPGLFRLCVGFARGDQHLDAHGVLEQPGQPEPTLQHGRRGDAQSHRPV